jgi:hypothetical protein
MGAVKLLASVLTLAAAAAAAAGPAAADPAPLKVAVVPGIAVNVDAARVDALGQDLADALSAELLVAAAGGLEVRRQLPVEGLPADCIAKPACTADVARRLGAAQLLFVVVVDTGAGGAVQIDSTWIEPATGKSASRPAIDLAPGADPKSRFVSAARSLFPDAPVRPKPKAGMDGKMTVAVPRHYTTPAKITTAVAAVGLGVGIGFGLAARSLYNSCDTTPMAPAGCDEKHDSIRTRALIADIGYAVAIGGAVATVVLYATSAHESRLVIEPTPEGVAVAARGRF